MKVMEHDVDLAKARPADAVMNSAAQLELEALGALDREGRPVRGAIGIGRVPGRDVIQSKPPVKPKTAKKPNNKSAAKANKKTQSKPGKRKAGKKAITSRAGGKTNRRAIKKNK